MKKTIQTAAIAALLLSAPSLAKADSQPGDKILTLGQDLTEQQRTELLQELGATEDAMIVEITNAEEHQYLGSYIPKAQIGTRALSSASITVTEEGKGLTVETKNINWVTNDMYINALITAGVKDADIYITSPIQGVSGTAALTGLIKAYELSSGEVIPEEQKQVANEEMVKSAQLADELGKEETNSLMTNIKSRIADHKPETREEMEQLIQEEAEKLNLSIPEEYSTGLTDLFMKMKEIDIDWHAVGDQLDKAKEKFNNFIESEEGKGLIDSVKTFFTNIVEIFKGWFSK